MGVGRLVEVVGYDSSFDDVRYDCEVLNRLRIVRQSGAEAVAEVEAAGAVFFSPILLVWRIQCRFNFLR